ncbi:DUF1150 family protein [Lutibaculum baratangense]|uniref:DUF1150 domain-containing protein n=1 Tax=Lutibaculum baratangense AMV1 TaxID=631454 RepID=V4RKU3_9HYPH|nr:DUF1150 domain-containing protein [Lutibaculum baratangense]ESR25904.1 protein of unknown function DUF1150 [Lutibaculum baratangense AMV1]
MIDHVLFEDEAHAISQEDLARLGDSEIAYLKPIMSDNLKELFPQAPEMAPGIRLFALHAADGTPIMLTDSRESALAGARQQELDMLSVH